MTHSRASPSRYVPTMCSSHRSGNLTSKASAWGKEASRREEVQRCNTKECTTRELWRQWLESNDSTLPQWATLFPKNEKMSASSLLSAPNASAINESPKKERNYLRKVIKSGFCAGGKEMQRTEAVSEDKRLRRWWNIERGYARVWRTTNLQKSLFALGYKSR